MRGTRQEPGTPKVRGPGKGGDRDVLTKRGVAEPGCLPSHVNHARPECLRVAECRSPSSTQWPQPGGRPRPRLRPGCSRRGVEGWRAFLAQCSPLLRPGRCGGVRCPRGSCYLTWLGLDWLSHCNPLPGRTLLLPAQARWRQGAPFDLPRQILGTGAGHTCV